MVCLRNICINTLHKGDNDDDDDNNNNKVDRLEIIIIIKWILKKQGYGYEVNVMHMNGYAPLPDPCECGNAHRAPQTVVNFLTLSYVFSQLV